MTNAEARSSTRAVVKPIDEQRRHGVHGSIMVCMAPSRCASLHHRMVCNATTAISSDKNIAAPAFHIVPCRYGAS